jgi:hypothetical protein
MAQTADYRAHLPHDRIGHHSRRVVDETPPAFTDPWRSLDVAVSCDCPDCQHLIDSQVTQLGERVDINKDGGTRESKPHRRNEALSAGEHAGFSTMLLQMCDSFVCRVGANVIEGCRNHVANLLPRQCRNVASHAGVVKES